MQYYKKLLVALERYFDRNDWKKLFMQGGCYWLANLLHQQIHNSYFMINRIEEHCALYFENGLYDIRGKIPSKNFKFANAREISFMKKNYVPHFNTEKLEQYLSECCLVKNE